MSSGTYSRNTKQSYFLTLRQPGSKLRAARSLNWQRSRVEKTERGTLRMADSADVFVKLPGR